MNNRDRFLATMAFQKTDRPCHMEHGFWNETYDRWVKEGLPKDVVLPELFFRTPTNDLFGYFDVIKIAYVMVEQYYIPAFEEETLSLTETVRTFRSNRGVLMREKRGSVSIPQFLEYPIKCREDYYELRDRLMGSPEKRYREDWESQISFISSQERDIVATHMDGFFGYPRELLGVEHLLTMYHDDPELMHTIIDDHLKALMSLYEQVIQDLHPDFAFIWEDMCYKNGPLISPRTFREFMLPAYQKLTRFLNQLGVKNVVVDSDGNIEKLIPLWLEGGVTGLLPFEVKTGLHVTKVRKDYPRLQIVGGVEKHCLEHGKAEIDAELLRVLPEMLSQGGYCVSLDHWVHDGISLENFSYYVEQVRNFPYHFTSAISIGKKDPLLNSPLDKGRENVSKTRGLEKGREDENTYFAADLGASSGRLMIAKVGPTVFNLEEVYRFENHPISIDGELFWDIHHLFEQLKQGIRQAFRLAPEVRSLAIDTWGTDFGLIDETGQLAIPPYSYREFAGHEMVDLVGETIPDEELYAMTGIQFLQVNSLFQLMAVKTRHPDRLASSRWFLMLPDLLNYFLTGKIQTEYTDASTTHFLNPLTRSWEKRIFHRLGLPDQILPQLVQPGTLAGRLLPSLAGELGIPQLEIKTCAAHDTASAIAAVPAVDGKPWAFISSGTWLLVGVETRQPYLDRTALVANVTNEAGVDGTIRLLKNLTGLWLIQCLQRDFQSQGKNYDFTHLVDAAIEARPFRSLIIPNAALFHNPPSMLEAIATFCQSTKQPVPQTTGEYTRCIFESLALACADVIATLGQLTGQKFERVHIIGGGAQNRFLNSCIANACGIDVYAGPVEATAIGNATIQAIADGLYPDLKTARKTIAASFPPEVYPAQGTEEWSKELDILHEIKDRYHVGY